jgi:hypothetical protein
MPAYVLLLPRGRSSKRHDSTADGEAGIDAGGAALIHLKKSAVGQFAQAVSGALRRKGPIVEHATRGFEARGCSPVD